MITIEEITVLVEIAVEFVLVFAFRFLYIMTVTFLVVFAIGQPWCCRMIMIMMITVVVCRCV